MGWPRWRWPEQRAASWAAGWRATSSALLIFASPHFSPSLLVFLIFLSSSPLLGLFVLLLLSSSSLLGCHLFLSSHLVLLLLSSSSLLGCLLLLFSSHLLVLLGHLLFSFLFLLSTSEMTRGHAACCHNLYFRAGGGCHFFLSSPRPAAALSIASVDVPNVGRGYAWSPLPRPPRLPPLRPRMSPQASKDQQQS